MDNLYTYLKKCTGCKYHLDVRRFRIVNKKGWLHPMCRECTNQYRKDRYDRYVNTRLEYYSRNKDRIRQVASIWAIKNKEKIKALTKYHNDKKPRKTNIRFGIRKYKFDTLYRKKIISDAIKRNLKNKERTKETQRKFKRGMVEKISDSYCNQLIFGNRSYPFKLNKNILAAKREIIKLKRITKEYEQN